MTGWECSPEALFRYFWDRTLAARGKRVWGGVASAAGSDARSRDEGDAGAHRGGAATPQTAPRRRNPLGRTAFCPRRRKEEDSRKERPSWSPRFAKGRTLRSHPFFHGLLGPSGRTSWLGLLAGHSRQQRSHLVQITGCRMVFLKLGEQGVGFLGFVLGERDLRAEELPPLAPRVVLRRFDQTVDRLL